MRLKVQYDPANQVWNFYNKDNGDFLFAFPLEKVDTELVLYFAKNHDKVPKDVGWSDLEEEKKKELLDWFEEDIFPTQEFGEFIVNDYENASLEVLQDIIEGKNTHIVKKPQEEFAEILSSIEISDLRLYDEDFIKRYADLLDDKIDIQKDIEKFNSYVKDYDFEDKKKIISAYLKDDDFYVIINEKLSIKDGNRLRSYIASHLGGNND